MKHHYNRRGLVSAKSAIPEAILSEELLAAKNKLERLPALRRYVRISLALLTLLAIMNSDFMWVAQKSTLLALDISFVFPSDELLDCYKSFEGYPEYCLDPLSAGSSMPLKWVLILILAVYFGADEYFKREEKSLIVDVSSLEVQASCLSHLPPAAVEEVTRRFKFGITTCPSCGRESRIEADKTLAVTCGSCGTKWTTGPIR